MDAHDAWIVVMGNRTPEDVVRDFGLTAPDGVDEWVGHAESEAVLQAPEDEREALREALEPHSAHFRASLSDAIAARESGQ
jgi:hypothetical protein